MSHEWSCRCARCRADMQAWVDRDDDEAEREAADRDELRYGKHDAD